MDVVAVDYWGVKQKKKMAGFVMKEIEGVRKNPVNFHCQTCVLKKIKSDLIHRLCAVRTTECFILTNLLLVFFFFFCWNHLVKNKNQAKHFGAGYLK